MFFCSGPPRSYALLEAAERLEDVAVAMHPSEHVFARVSSSGVTLWGARRSLSGTGRRLLGHCRRRGQYLDQLDKEGVDDGLRIQECPLRQLWTVWVTGDRLAVVEKDAQCVEFYVFDGLQKVLQRAEAPDSPSIGDSAADVEEQEDITNAMLDQPSFNEPEPDEAGDNSGQHRETFQLKAKFLEDYPLNQGANQSDYEDVAASMSAVPGSKYLFVGMASGMISVVEVAESSESDKSQGSWFSNSEQSTKIWKIDVRAHLSVADEEEDPPTCYDLTCASTDLPSKITSLYLVASFEGGKCFIMLLSPAKKSIDQLLSLVNTERDTTSTLGNGRCTTTSLDASGSRLALGWADGGVSLFRLSMKGVEQTGKAKNGVETNKDAKKLAALALEPIRELSLASWGYKAEDIGSVTALAWSHDARSVVVGYELRGFSLFSTDGCRLMSSLPQHKLERPDKTNEHTSKEMCVFGVMTLLWTRESNSLIVVPRGEQSTQLVPLLEDEILKEIEDENDVEVIKPEDLFAMIEARVQKKEDGLCLSLSGAPGRCGAWVRSDNSFTRTRDGGAGPAETCGQIQGGDLLVGINDNTRVVNLPFEQIVGVIKELSDNEDVMLSFMRINWEQVFPLAVEVLSSTEFMDAHGIRFLEDENLCIREYALRMQALHGDCDLEERPPLMEFERRAKFDGWEAIQGTSSRVAKHKYVKLLFALFPVWNPHHFLNVITEYGNALLAQKVYLTKQKKLKELHAHREHVKMRSRSLMSFAEFDFAKTVPLSGGRASRLALLERSNVRLVAEPALDDPCALTSCVNWSVPSEFKKCCPLRLVALSDSGNQMAVAGQRGFCLLNLATGKWRMFGNVNDEQDMFIYSMLWVTDDVLVVNFTRFSEKHQSLHLQAYPRNHLDEESILEQVVFAREGENAMRSRETMHPSGRDDGDDCFYIMESDNAQKNLFCVSRNELWCFGLSVGGSIKQNDIRMKIELKRQVNLPSRVTESEHVGTCRRNSILDFAVLPRFLHVQDEKLREQQQRKYQAEREHEHDDEGWLSSFVNMLVGGEVPDQYTPEEVLPRFAFLDSAGDVIVWDPENRSQRLLCSNVTTMAHLFVTPEACASWPAPCRLIYGLYGPEGMKVWLPLLDGVYIGHTKAFEEDTRRLETFLACHDPLRAKTYEIEFGTAPATAELYEQVISEYGVALESFLSNGTVGMSLKEGCSNMRGCVTSVDDPSAKDSMLRFDFDVKVLGTEQTFGLLVGVSQDVYVPSGVFLPCYDVFARVQPIFHTLLCFLVLNEQLSWARLVLAGVRKQFALSTPTQELFLHSMLEACFAKKCPEDKFLTAIQLLRPNEGEEGDIAEYCEIVAHVARKSEPSRLKVLFPAAGDPMDLLVICQQRSELRTAANFLLILEECSTASGSSLPLRMESAAELLGQCIDQEEWVLAQHVVRVAREWEHPPFDDSSYSRPISTGTSIDEQLAALVWDNLARGEFERVVWCVEDLQAKLPHTPKDKSHSEQDEVAIMDRLHQIFVQGNKRRQLRTLLQAVTEAHYEDWIARIKHVMEK
ncbi:WD40 repeat protein [Phytophthora boehmeriae]|uniref:WD40 repeat protein n=1 Tax=Phytophthora boehmeriae TaxID=109152 RepID=A0A8T1WHM7_9STRA|nr:WD40 repeat protein [Phytophthora boehmeriae]